jgi:hypothetical protein
LKGKYLGEYIFLNMKTRMENSDESRTRIDEQRRKYSKMEKRQRITWLCHLLRMEENRMSKKDLHSRTGRDNKKGKTQEKKERGSRKRSSSAGSEKMERVGGR